MMVRGLSGFWNIARMLTAVIQSPAVYIAGMCALVMTLYLAVLVVVFIFTGHWQWSSHTTYEGEFGP